MLYGEVRPYGHFRFVNFGHPPPLVFSAEYRKFMEIDKSRMVQFLPLGLQLAEDDPDRNRYFSLEFRQRRGGASAVGEVKLISSGGIFFLFNHRGFFCREKKEKKKHLKIIRAHNPPPAKN